MNEETKNLWREQKKEGRIYWIDIKIKFRYSIKLI
jgi:hypothetical protein